MLRSALVTGTRAIPVGADRCVLVFIRLVVTGMATCTVRLIRRSRPGNGLAVATVTIGTGRTGTVIAGIGAGRMAEYQRQPAVRGMTFVALQAGNKMTGWLAGCGRTVMAAGA